MTSLYRKFAAMKASKDALIIGYSSHSPAYFIHTVF